MKATEIIKAIESGNYKIEYDNYCGCSIDWSDNGDGLRPTCDSNECWQGHSLYIGDVLVAENLQNEPLKVHVKIDDDTDDDFSFSDLNLDWGISNDDPNPAHAEAEREALVEFLREKLDEGYHLFYKSGDFANTGSLIVKKGDFDEDDDGDYTSMTPEEFTDEYYRYTDDPTTVDYQSCYIDD